jgi:hypothetical protein
MCAQVPDLLAGVAVRTPQQRQLCVRLAMWGMEGLTSPLAVPNSLPTSVKQLLESPALVAADSPAPSGAAQMEVDGASVGGAQEGEPPAVGHVVPALILRQFPFLAHAPDRCCTRATHCSLLPPECPHLWALSLMGTFRAAFLAAAQQLLLYVPQPSGPRITTPRQAALQVCAQGAGQHAQILTLALCS